MPPAGAVAGLVAITPASGYVTAGGALFIGLAAGGICYSATLLRERAPASTTRSTCSRSTASAACSAPSRQACSRRRPSGGVPGLIDGNSRQVVIQLVAVGATIAYAVVATFIIVKVVDFVLGLRVEPADEEMGLDLALHGEVAYQPVDGPGPAPGTHR